MRRISLALVVASLVAGGCAPRVGTGGPRADELSVGGARFRLEYLPADAGAAREVARALELAVPRVARWGGLAAPVTITIHPTHAALEAAAALDGYPWLRAWARYATIDLESPRRWGLLARGRARILEVVTHELAHCAMYQRSADAWSWPYKEIPRWFTEGLASVTAEQGERWPGVEALGRAWARSLDPLAPSEALYRERSKLVYAGAHHAFAFLLDRYGEGRVRRVLDLMGEGRRFPSAFREAIGIGDDAFLREFRRFVVGAVASSEAVNEPAPAP